jgi:hypothetical protein
LGRDGLPHIIPCLLYLPVDLLAPGIHVTSSSLAVVSFFISESIMSNARVMTLLRACLNNNDSDAGRWR